MNLFNNDIARLLLETCRYTYAASFPDVASIKDKQEALAWMNQKEVPESIMLLDDGGIPATSVACVVAYEGMNIVAYMGTKTEFKTIGETADSIADWIQNLEVLPVPFRLTAEQLGQEYVDKNDLGGRVHHGFLEELCAVQAKVVRELLKHDGKNRPLYVTGHSQGGAEAALATRAFVAGGFPVAATYTFAAPRSGDAAFAQSIPETVPVHRIEFGNDIVPHAPPLQLTMGVRALVWAMQTCLPLPEHGKRLLNTIQRVTANAKFVGIGRLCYGSAETKTFQVGLSAQQESGMFFSRLRRLVLNQSHWGEHHHLAGTTEEVKAGIRGNYTALVSDYEMSA